MLSPKVKAWLRENWFDVPGYVIGAVLAAGVLAGLAALVVWAVASGHWYLAPLVLLAGVVPFLVWRDRDEWL